MSKKILAVFLTLVLACIMFLAVVPMASLGEVEATDKDPEALEDDEWEMPTLEELYALLPEQGDYDSFGRAWLERLGYDFWFLGEYEGDNKGKIWDILYDYSTEEIKLEGISPVIRRSKFEEWLETVVSWKDQDGNVIRNKKGEVVYTFLDRKAFKTKEIAIAINELEDTEFILVATAQGIVTLAGKQLKA